MPALCENAPPSVHPNRLFCVSAVHPKVGLPKFPPPENYPPPPCITCVRECGPEAPDVTPTRVPKECGYGNFTRRSRTGSVVVCVAASPARGSLWHKPLTHRVGLATCLAGVGHTPIPSHPPVSRVDPRKAKCASRSHRFSTDDGEYQGQSYKGHSGIVLTLVAPEEPFGDAGLLSGSKDGTLRGWDVQSAKQVFRLRNPSPVETVALANRKAYAGTSRGAVLTVDAQGELVAQLKVCPLSPSCHTAPAVLER